MTQLGSSIDKNIQVKGKNRKAGKQTANKRNAERSKRAPKEKARASHMHEGEDPALASNQQNSRSDTHLASP
eukprot:scaffold76247_cov17-Tisochrysis_lutea.AAC.2